MKKKMNKKNIIAMGLIASLGISSATMSPIEISAEENIPSGLFEEVGKAYAWAPSAPVVFSPEEIKANNEVATVQLVSEISTQEAVATARMIEPEVKKDGFKYISQISMPEKHQRYLYDLCQKHGLDYLRTLALLKNESQFDHKAISSTRDYGYMQINIINHKNLARSMGTKNAPLDPYVNMQWGTQMIKNAYAAWDKSGKTGAALDEAALSTYNKGLTGYKKYGPATTYISRVNKEYNYLKSLL